MANMWNSFVSNIGAMNAPFGFAPGQDPYQSGLQYIGNIGTGMLASGDANPLKAFGKASIMAQEKASDDSRQRMAQQMMMDSAEEKRKEREAQAQQQAMMEEAISQLPPDQQAMARMMPEKFFGEQISQQFAGGSDATANMRDFQFAQENPGFADFINPRGDDITQQVNQRRQIAESMGLAPDDPQYQAYVLTGKMPREDAATLTATDKKALWAAEDELPAIEGTIETLNRAMDLNKQTFTGVGADWAGYIGAKVPGGSYVFDKNKAENTVAFQDIMSLESINMMAESLKGATTNFELQEFKKILADPATPPSLREKTIKRMLTLAERVKGVKKQRINAISGQANEKPADDPLNAAREAISRGADPEAVRQRLIENGIDPTGL